MDGLRNGGLVLTVNGGSSSIKFALFAAGARRILRGGIDRIGSRDASIEVKADDQKWNCSRAIKAPNHSAAVAELFGWMEATIDSKSLRGVGHRVVHGGPKYFEPQRITGELLAELRRLTPFDPQHLPEETLLVEEFFKRAPELPQVACFDTAFHHDLPVVAQLFAIPRRFYADGLRRYGFHGLSYAYVIEELRRLDGAAAANGRVIVAHLGNGASLAAVKDGKSIDTSMGFTPSGGIPMSTRSGDLDPGVAAYLMKAEGLSPEQFDRMVNFESGLLGVSEVSSDMRDLIAAEPTNQNAAEAIALFCYQVKKYIGAFAAALGGLDTLIFSGGIGENLPQIRARICDGLSFLGVTIDPAPNMQNAEIISPPRSGVTVRVIKTDEESVIARSVCRVLNEGETQ